MHVALVMLAEAFRDLGVLMEIDLKIEEAASSAARLLGYECMKDNQMKIVKEFVKGSQLYILYL